jgi:hypothetical protein
MSDFTDAEIDVMTNQLVKLRAKLRGNGATALTPTPEWSALQKEVASLNRKLKADSAAKLARSRAATV